MDLLRGLSAMVDVRTVVAFTEDGNDDIRRAMRERRPIEAVFTAHALFIAKLVEDVVTAVAPKVRCTALWRLRAPARVPRAHTGVR